jgi:DNA-binding Lrp family transcriptional regulator
MIEVNMSPEEVRVRIKAAAPDGRIACATAFRLAEELGLSRKDLGELLDELKIKITQCQLGCF